MGWILNKRVLLAAMLGHTFFFVVAVAFLYTQYQKNINKYLYDLYYASKSDYAKTIRILNKNTDLLAKLLIDDEIKNIVQKANKDIALRDELIKKFMPKYQILQQNGFYLVHFHLKNGVSLVRFHNLKKFGDKLEYRPALEYVLQNGVVYHGFELGRGVGGFRSIYPLIKNNKVIGSVEISFSMKNLINYMFEHEHLALVIKKDILSHLLAHKKIAKNFKICKLNQNYFIWGNACVLFKHTHAIDFSKKINIVENKLVLSYPVYDFKHQKEGYMLIVIPLKDIQILKEMKKSFENILIIISVLYVAILFGILGIYYYYILKAKSEIDYLTGTFNRAACNRRIQHLNNYSMLVVDIDHFKKINDTYGHDMGDKILKEIANLLKGSVRSDDIVCRWGGEEFVIILKNAKLNDAQKVAEKIRQAIQNHTFEGINVTVSIGVEEFKGNFDKTFKEADIKLYRAKNNGRNRVEV
ncbi:MAG: diguanylate cyclase [Epsilonproteobacteria bacterium]|nr:diguanylate cyclase [Campylobacterota bacterium]